jgi:hypothetical protein
MSKMGRLALMLQEGIMSEVYRLRCVGCRERTSVPELPREQPFCTLCYCPLVLDEVVIVNGKEDAPC